MIDSEDRWTPSPPPRPHPGDPPPVEPDTFDVDNTAGMIFLAITVAFAQVAFLIWFVLKVLS